MEITKDTLLKDILAEYPWLKEELIEAYPKFRMLDTPVGRIFLKKATIEDLSKKAGKSPEYLIQRLERMISEHEKLEKR